MHSDIESLQKWLTEHFISFATNLVTAALILVIGRWVSRSLVKTIRKVMVKKGVDPELRTFTTSLTYALLMIVVVLAALGRHGVQTPRWWPSWVPQAWRWDWRCRDRCRI